MKTFAGLVAMMALTVAGFGQAAAAPADPFPPVDQKFFTAASPSVETVNSFLKSLWGFDSNRLYKVMAVQSTAVQSPA